MKKPKITEDIFAEIATKYKSGCGYKRLSKIFGFDIHRIRYLLKKRGIHEPSREYRIYSVNEHYFDCIDSAEKAYWLGFLIADGCVMENNGGGYVISLKLKKSDIDHLYKFKNALNCTNPIYPEFSDGKLIAYRLRIFNKYLGKVLIEKGVLLRKTTISRFPDTDIVPEKYLRFFILGVFDADGCLSVESNNRQHTLIFTGTRHMLEGIQCHLFKNVTGLSTINHVYDSKGNYCNLVFRGNNQIKKIMDYLYEGSIHLCLERKYKRYQDLLKFVK